MSTKEYVISMINDMTDEQIDTLVAFLTNFQLSERYNDETRKALDDVKNGRNLSKPFYSVQELMEDLNADD